MVEERVASQVRRLREKQEGAPAEQGLWPDNLKELAKLGLSQDELLAVLREETGAELADADLEACGRDPVGRDRVRHEPWSRDHD